ncbi:MAG TPA: YkgJ family cysteine cluster protein [Lentisphaeria bacterium]|nr:MAG: hypothetical protein A2X45_21210 [Lentisphaerae bacterium GWF2_50_93]HCE46665.1 YkgJ family cysteine cluster protein [Lentisphaeria bacterium]
MYTKRNYSEFKCIRCGQCCRWHGYVRISEREAEDIAGLIGMELCDFYENMTIPGEDGIVSLVENADGSCPFYIGSPPGCRIYARRPSQCRTYPFKWSNPGDPCPGGGMAESEYRQK